MYGVFVGGLASSTEQEVREVFSKFGEIESVKIIREGVGQPKGYGFVNFIDEEARNKALAANEELKINGNTWFVRKGHTSLARDQVMAVHITGFPETWSKTKIKDYASNETGLEILNVVQQGLKTTICFKKADVTQAITSLNGATVENRQLVVQAALPKNDKAKNGTFSAILYELALQNNITPLLDQQQFYLLEKSLRTLYVGNIAPKVSELEIGNVFSEYGPVEDVSLVLNLETGLHRGFAFVVYESHEVCLDVLNTDKFHSINGNIVKVQNSKPPKAVAELAKQAGLNDMEGHRTPLLDQLMSAAKQIMNSLNSLGHAQSQPPASSNSNGGGQTFVDPSTGNMFTQNQPSSANTNSTPSATVTHASGYNVVAPKQNKIQQVKQPVTSYHQSLPSVNSYQNLPMNQFQSQQFLQQTVFPNNLITNANSMQNHNNQLNQLLAIQQAQQQAQQIALLQQMGHMQPQFYQVQQQQQLQQQQFQQQQLQQMLMQQQMQHSHAANQMSTKPAAQTQGDLSNYLQSNSQNGLAQQLLAGIPSANGVNNQQTQAQPQSTMQKKSPEMKPVATKANHSFPSTVSNAVSQLNQRSDNHMKHFNPY